MATQRKHGISWTDETWNPIRGCTRVSEGCKFCYAERVAYRFSGPGQPYEGLAVLKNRHASWTGKIEFVEKHLLDPLSWKKPRRVFVNSMSDLFHENVTDEMRDRIFAVMALCPQHTFQVLTKRPERMLAYFNLKRERCMSKAAADSTAWHVWSQVAVIQTTAKKAVPCASFHWAGDTLDQIAGWPLPNVWLGVSVENQKAADERIPLLLDTPAAVRFLSCEPLLGPLTIDRWLTSLASRWPEVEFGSEVLPGVPFKVHPDRKINWVIAGCESGHGARSVSDDAFRSLRDQCVAAGAPFFLKQMMVGGKLAHAPALEGRDWKQFPAVQA